MDSFNCGKEKEGAWEEFQEYSGQDSDQVTDDARRSLSIHSQTTLNAVADVDSDLKSAPHEILSYYFESEKSDSESSPYHFSIPSQSDIGWRSEGSHEIRDVKCDVLAHWLRAKQEEKMWTEKRPGEGVFVKRSKGNYSFAPVELINDGTHLYEAIAKMNVRVSLNSPHFPQMSPKYLVCHDRKLKCYQLHPPEDRTALCADSSGPSTTSNS